MKKLIVLMMGVAATAAVSAEAFDAGVIDFARTDGRLKRELHCSGVMVPIVGRNTLDIEHFTNEYKRLKFTAVRTHDFSLKESNQRVLDTHHIFPLFHLDEKDPRNYYFDATDDLLDDLTGTGQQVLYRLGTSIEHARRGQTHNTKPPSDYAKYARVLEGIIRHYNYGWGKNGKRMGIKYWEIWNEPEGSIACWDGTLDEFYNFYEVVAKHLKKQFPDLMIGGCGSASGGINEKSRRFLSEMAKRKVPLDFYSWHIYANEVGKVQKMTCDIRAFLDAHGYGKTEVVLDEWHYLGRRDWGVGWGKDGKHFYRSELQKRPEFDEFEYYRQMHSTDGRWGVNSAAFNTALVTAMHDMPLDWSYYYGLSMIGDWGLWTPTYKPHRNYYSMLFLGELINGYPNRVKAEVAAPVYALAGRSDAGKAAVLITDFKGDAARIALTLKGLALPKRFRVRRIDAERMCAETTVEVPADGRLVLAKPAGAARDASAVWLLEELGDGAAPFRCEYTAVCKAIPRLRGVMSPAVGRLTRQDVIDLRTWGANVMRWQFDCPREKLERGVAVYQEWLADRLAHLESLLPDFAAGGIKVIIDMHMPPGGKGETAFKMFSDAALYERYLQNWEIIAARFKGNGTVVAYDLINEPNEHPSTKIDYWQAQEEATRRIRAIDPEKPVIVTVAKWGSPAAFETLKPIAFKNVFYTCHFYEPMAFTHQGVGDNFAKQRAGEFVRYPSGEWDREWLRGELRHARAFQLKYGARIYIGEVGVIRCAPGAAQWLDDAISIFEEYGWDWSFHAYREWINWSAEHSADLADTAPVAAPTDRLKVLLRWFKK